MMTMREWLENIKDLDGYIAKGGRLGDLTMPSQDDIPFTLAQAIANELGQKVTARLERFTGAVAEAAGDSPIGEKLNEEQLQKLWRESGN